VDRIYQMLKDLTDVLEEEQVTYWIEGGTLLGAVRHKGLIPWDDDADIGVPLTEEAQLVALGARFAELGYELQQWFYGFKFYPVDGEVIPQADKTFLYPFVDVFLVDWFRGSSFYPRTNLFVERSFRSEDLFPLRECAFGPLVLKCAHNPVPYLNACYGQEGEWQTMAHRGKDHRTYANERSEVHVLQSLETFRPALPSRPLLDRARQSARGPAAASPQPHSHAPAPADV
jgi:lipopolysaccharide cholinephosphotransferase